jgi:uncharacterized damage-inducible protein DinB
MSSGVSFDALIEFTNYERAEWREWFSAAPSVAPGVAPNGHGGASRLTISTGPHNSGRIRTVGELALHIFVAEKHHVDRLARRPLTDPPPDAATDVDALFEFGLHSRRALSAYVGSELAVEWDAPLEFEIMPGRRVSVTPRKFVTHILLHEIRHWAQIGTMVRIAGHPGPCPDLLFSPVMGGGAIHG